MNLRIPSRSKGWRPRLSGSASTLSPVMLLIPGLLVLIFLFLWPLSQMIVMSFTDPVMGLDNYRRFF